MDHTDSLLIHGSEVHPARKIKRLEAVFAAQGGWEELELDCTSVRPRSVDVYSANPWPAGFLRSKERVPTHRGLSH